MINENTLNFIRFSNLMNTTQVRDDKENTSILWKMSTQTERLKVTSLNA
ncbi:hypothetical protein KMC98_gp06 [Lactococcus phage CHPC967]|uniref:Uncharacterized protein n=1 Tax=Lactococcus phage CHPC967 TaxID=2675259 RepID=A0A650EU03_9CAUD|nr:hypothetical protein KMC98_gp06 [Lactococcus phage CHPC967]QGT53443.1 hypothetical protein CHPC967_001108 [Lactococcus phage CHPC967]